MISKLAYVSGKAQLGANVTVEPFAYIADDVIVGDGCWIGPGAVLMDGARLGRNCQVHTAAVVAGIPQDLKFKGEYTTAEVGDNTMIRESVTISRGTAAKGKTVVGSNVLLMAYVHVGHDCVVGDRCILANRVSLGGEVEIDDWAILGGHCAVHQFSRIGAHVMVSGGSAFVRGYQFDRPAPARLYQRADRADPGDVPHLVPIGVLLHERVRVGRERDAAGS